MSRRFGVVFRTLPLGKSKHGAQPKQATAMDVLVKGARRTCLMQEHLTTPGMNATSTANLPIQIYLA